MTDDSDTNILSSPPRLGSTAVHLSFIIPLFNIIYCSFNIHFFFVSFVSVLYMVLRFLLIHISSSFMLFPQLDAMLNTPRHFNDDLLLLLLF